MQRISEFMEQTISVVIYKLRASFLSGLFSILETSHSINSQKKNTVTVAYLLKLFALLFGCGWLGGGVVVGRILYIGVAKRQSVYYSVSRWPALL